VASSTTLVTAQLRALRTRWAALARRALGVDGGDGDGALIYSVEDLAHVTPPYFGARWDPRPSAHEAWTELVRQVPRISSPFTELLHHRIVAAEIAAGLGFPPRDAYVAAVRAGGWSALAGASAPFDVAWDALAAQSPYVSPLIDLLHARLTRLEANEAECERARHEQARHEQGLAVPLTPNQDSDASAIATAAGAAAAGSRALAPKAAARGRGRAACARAAVGRATASKHAAQAARNAATARRRAHRSIAAALDTIDELEDDDEASQGIAADGHL